MRIALAGSYPTGTLEKFQKNLPEHVFFSVENQEEYEVLTDVDCIIVRTLKTPETVLSNKANLKAVIRWGTGYDSVDIQAAGRRGIPVFNTPGVNSYTVAELTLGMMIALNRNLLGYWKNIQKDNWNRNAYTSLSLNHKTVGIIGSGNIGRRVAALVQAFGAQVVYYDALRLSPDQEQELKMTYVSLNDLLERADLVSLHIPLLDSTHHIIGSEQLARMKSSACLINTARGGLVDDSALLQALQRGQLSGAGLDCIEDERSPVTKSLMFTQNVLITPHIGGSTADLTDAMITEITKNIHEIVSGKRGNHIVNKEFLSTEYS